MLKKSLLVAAISAVSVSAFAGGVDAASVSPSHAYVGGQAGYAIHSSFDRTGTLAAANATTYQSSYAKRQKDFAARLYAGYMFNKNLGLELGMGTFGSQKLALKGGVESAKTTPYNYKTKARLGFDADVVGQLGMTESLYVFGKAGMAYVDFSTKSIVDSVDAVKTSTWHWMPRAELGLGYTISPSMSATVSYAQYFGKTSKVSSEANDNNNFKKFAPSFGVAALGLQYSF